MKQICQSLELWQKYCFIKNSDNDINQAVVMAFYPVQTAWI